jgi:hypothetical protein
MLKKGMQRYIINKSLLFIAVFTGMLLLPCAVMPDDTINDFEIKPAYDFVYKAGRDPFEPRYKTEAAPAMIDVDITTFSLQGITESKGAQAALFKSKSGNPFGYIFMDGKLYGENERVIPDVTGEIKENAEVLLVQGDKEVLFKLDDQVDGPNIRPDTK